MQKIRFTKMVCLGIIGNDQLFKEFLPLAELRLFFEQTYQRKAGCVLFLNKNGRPVFIQLPDMTAAEKAYFGL